MGTAVERFDEKAHHAFDKIGRNEVYQGELLRHRVYTRFLHWMVALWFSRVNGSLLLVSAGLKAAGRNVSCALGARAWRSLSMTG